eukprot:6308630-Prymnesium_polylepis.1
MPCVSRGMKDTWQVCRCLPQAKSQMRSSGAALLVLVLSQPVAAEKQHRRSKKGGKTHPSLVGDNGEKCNALGCSMASGRTPMHST